jgi:hypothetical protein
MAEYLFVKTDSHQSNPNRVREVINKYLGKDSNIVLEEKHMGTYVWIHVEAPGISDKGSWIAFCKFFYGEYQEIAKA